MSQNAISIVLIGRGVDMGRIVAQNLKPELKVIHFIASPETAKEDLPLLIQHKEPSHTSAGGVGSQDYSKPAEAIVLGLGYTNDVVDELRQACKGLENGLPWLAGGYPKEEFEEMMRTDPPPAADKQGPITAEMTKNALKKVLDEGKGGKDGLYLWHER